MPLIRHWDPEKRYEGAVIKVYAHWCLEVSWQQHTLGTYIIFCRREGVRLETELMPVELSSLQTVKREIQESLQTHRAFHPDHFNHLQLGNLLPQLHIHGVPRYFKPRQYLGRTWEDPTPTHLPTWSSEPLPRDLIERLRDEMGSFLPID